jgi:AcrR family transcriptional regulator
MTMPLFLLSALVGIAFFFATLFSAAQVIVMRDKLRWTHLGALAFGLAVMVVLTLADGSPMLGLSPQSLASAFAMWLAAFAAACILFESRWRKLFPVIQLVFALAVASGLPFAPAA